MKKWLSIVIVFIAVVSLVACKKEPVGDPPIVNGQDYFDAVVTLVSDDYVLGKCQRSNL